MNKKTIEILCGIPCSGKSTYADKQITKNLKLDTTVISRDTIRDRVYGLRYKPDFKREQEITIRFNESLAIWLEMPGINKIILDNTHCKEAYIDSIIDKYKGSYNIVITYFDIPLWRAKLRNYIRYIKTGKWIPNDVMNSMYNNYNKINRKKYEFF